MTDDLTVENPTASVRRAAIVLGEQDTTEATCYGWVPQARRALVAAVNPAPIRETLIEHARLTPEGEDGDEPGSVILEDDTPWLCGACNEYVGTGHDYEEIVSTHQAHMLRLLIVGPA